MSASACMSMTNKSRINLEPWGQHQLQKIASPLSSVLFLPLPYLALMAPKSDELSIQSFFGIQGQGRQVVELVKAKRGRPPKAAAVQTCKELEARCSPTQTPSSRGRRQPSSEAATGSRAWGHSRMTSQWGRPTGLGVVCMQQLVDDGGLRLAGCMPQPPDPVAAA